MILFGFVPRRITFYHASQLSKQTAQSWEKPQVTSIDTDYCKFGNICERLASVAQ